MNILPHKSWHVWNRDNIERVRKDEEQDLQKKEREREREINIQREKRYSLLKQRAGLSETIKNSDDLNVEIKETKNKNHLSNNQKLQNYLKPWIDKDGTQRHINFFENEEREDKKKEHLSHAPNILDQKLSETKSKDKYNQNEKTDFFYFLNQNLCDNINDPITKERNQRKKERDEDISLRSEEQRKRDELRNEAKRRKKEHDQDPLTHMNSQLSKRNKIHSTNVSLSTTQHENKLKKDIEDSEKEEKKDKKGKKKKRKEKEKEKDKKLQKLQKLRDERLKRERIEQERTSRILHLN